MFYYQVEKEDQHILLVEKEYNKQFEAKTEAVFAQCNGYMGIRAGLGIRTLNEKPGMFLAGFYNRANESETTELVNCPDITNLALSFRGEEVHIDDSTIRSFERTLDTRTGELQIQIYIETRKGSHLGIGIRRFASLSQLPLFCQRISIHAEEDGEIILTTGIDGQQTNSGQSHFSSCRMRVYDHRIMHCMAQTGNNNSLSIASLVKTDENETKVDFILKRKSVFGEYHYNLSAGEDLILEKYAYITQAGDISVIKNVIENCEKLGYLELLREHEIKFEEYWRYANIYIEGASLYEEAAVAFALYHMRGMASAFTDRLSVGAKGLTGEGYKGHVFWDTEIYILPMFQYVFPEIARNLLKYRYRGLPGARIKARQYGYEGAMYPWESAVEGVEETPLYAAINIRTGKATKIWSGIKEHHVTADVAYAVWSYYQSTKDECFMKEYGCEILLETADFWCSRAVWNTKKNQYEICDVIGPDEYTEHVNNNAYTNYMAKNCVEYAMQILMQGKVKSDSHREHKYQRFLEYIYLPEPNESGIIPQDDTFLQKKELNNIEKYRNSPIKQKILRDYNRDEVVDMQVLKQADIVMLMNLCPECFNSQTIRKNVTYYEQRTIHDLSLSLCAHSIACANIGEAENAYKFFQQAMQIDINRNPNDSADGIHAAAMGGLWSCLIKGNAGLRQEEGILSLSPCLPKVWKSIKFWLCIDHQYIQFVVRRDSITIIPEKTLLKPFKIRLFGKEYEVKGEDIYDK